MLYADCFNDYLDYTVKPNVASEYYGQLSAELHASAKKSRRYGYVLKAAATLSDVLTIKYDLGLRTRRAYEAGDLSELERLAKEDYAVTEKRVRAYADAFERQWMLDNKPQGFDVQHHRLGALVFRLEACRKRILAYVKGEIDRIEELDEELLPFGEKEKSINLNKAPVYATTGILYCGHVPG
jgi:hypothetical protein